MAELEHIRAFGLNNPVAVIPNGLVIDDSLEIRKTSNSVRRFAFVGRLNRIKNVDFHVVPGVENRLLTGAEHQEDRAPKAKKQGGQDERNDGQHEGTVAEYLFSGSLVAFSHQDRRLRGTAHGGERGKSGNAHDNRHCDADAGQGAGTDVRDMADVHAVNHVIENVDDLCGNCRERQFKKK